MAETATENPSPSESAVLLTELVRHHGEQQTRRSEAKWATLKAIGVALVGTAAVGITTAAVNYAIQKNELAIERERLKHQIELEKSKFQRETLAAQRQQEQEYLEGFLKFALDEDLQKRIDFAQYVASITLNQEMRDLWGNYHERLEGEIADSREDLRAINADLQAELQKSELNIAKINALGQRINVLSKRLGDTDDIVISEGTLRYLLQENVIDKEQYLGLIDRAGKRIDTKGKVTSKSLDEATLAYLLALGIIDEKRYNQLAGKVKGNAKVSTR